MISQEYLQNVLNYDGSRLIWLVDRKSNKVKGREAGWMSSEGYRVVMLDNITYQAHRLIWFYVYGKQPIYDIDHINGIKDDNRIENLRDVPALINSKNQKKHKTNTTGITGVYWETRLCKWRAQGTRNYKRIHLGLYIEKWDAMCARKSWEVKNNFHENHGRPE